MKATGVSVEEWVLPAIDERLSYGDSRSQWFNGAAKMRLELDPILDEAGVEEDVETRIAWLQEAAREKAEREQE